LKPLQPLNLEGLPSSDFTINFNTQESRAAALHAWWFYFPNSNDLSRSLAGTTEVAAVMILVNSAYPASTVLIAHQSFAI
jgi:hypothetical protein